MIALDLFCGAGGASMGLHRAGYEVVGIDRDPQPHYPFTFIQADALRPPLDLSAFDLIWASPPCQAFSVMLRCRPGYAGKHPNLIPETRILLRRSGSAYIIENVPGAPLESPTTLCGTMFGLKVFRHRAFETNFPIVLTPPHPRHAKGATIRGEMFSVVGGAGGGWRTIAVPSRGYSVRFNRGTLKQWADAMGIDWMTRQELSQAVPPAYSAFIAKQLLNHSLSVPSRRDSLASVASP